MASRLVRNALPNVSARAHIGYLHAFVRFMADRRASFFGKLWVLFAIAYVVMPLDVVPDFAPIIGWLDDLGVVAITLGYLARVLAPYRFPAITTYGATVDGAPSSRALVAPR